MPQCTAYAWHSGQYSFALADNSPLKEAMDQQILQELSEPDWPAMLQRYLPDEG
ncbi:MAG: hypothetical protein HC922_02305 [Leptolyngbyaceae cyanobacterium SM2_3_12]|nr:hypothetical protein [Leptolyngbyaceae cyanobacterium SM2_3_12]